jgi:hypothetical protein
MDHEDDLITSRLNWLITSQSFLFAAHATLFRGGGAQQVIGAEVPLLVRLIPLIGMLSGILIYTAIFGGVVALMHNRSLLRTHLRAVLSRARALRERGIQVDEQFVRQVRFEMLKETTRRRAGTVSRRVGLPGVRYRPQGVPGRHQG